MMDFRDPSHLARFRAEEPFFATSPEAAAITLRECREEADRTAGDLAGVRAYCMFIGYPRSGHSLVGALIDAHREAAIAHELDALAFLELGATKNQLFHLLLANTRAFAHHGRVWGDYAYGVPGQWQGRFENLRVIGDKKGASTTFRMMRNPMLLDTLRRTVEVDIKFLHVVRNPFDNITTMLLRGGTSLEACVASYFALAAANTALASMLPAGALLEVHSEEISKTPAESLKRVESFLGLTDDADHRADCAKVVFTSPKKTRTKVEWPADVRRLVVESAKPFPFLERYTFED